MLIKNGGCVCVAMRAGILAHLTFLLSDAGPCSPDHQPAAIKYAASKELKPRSCITHEAAEKKLTVCVCGCIC